MNASPAQGRGRRRDRGSGQALVEFAFVLPVIVLLAFAALDIGRAVFTYNTLTAAARTAVRVAAVNQLDPATPLECDQTRPVEDPADPHWTSRGCALLAAAALGLRPDDVEISYTTPVGTTLHCSPQVNVGCMATVELTYRWDPITPIAGSLIGPIVMTATSEQPVERLFP